MFRYCSAPLFLYSSLELCQLIIDDLKKILDLTAHKNRHFQLDCELGLLSKSKHYVINSEHAFRSEITRSNALEFLLL